MNHYLIAWGYSIRYAKATDLVEACRKAFGVCENNMTVRQIKTSLKQMSATAQKRALDAMAQRHYDVTGIVISGHMIKKRVLTRKIIVKTKLDQLPEELVKDIDLALGYVLKRQIELKLNQLALKYQLLYDVLQIKIEE